MTAPTWLIVLLGVTAGELLLGALLCAVLTRVGHASQTIDGALAEIDIARAFDQHAADAQQFNEPIPFRLVRRPVTDIGAHRRGVSR